ncbi:hypothetical protein U1737_09460 [Sphingomonas sp. LB3N6]|uniref:hypothetical protein n=1 Tax=Sphingomonas fucosidasi TaxID=3096164 RepID=UPI002FC7264A
MAIDDTGIADSWHPWNGGRCPVADDAAVAVRCRYGPRKFARAGDLRWSHDQYLAYGAEDIVAYALVDESPAPAAVGPLRSPEPAEDPFARAGDTP